MFNMGFYESLKAPAAKKEIFSFSCFLAAGWVFALRSSLIALRPSIFALPVLANRKQGPGQDR
jgi:hypothetical protein